MRALIFKSLAPDDFIVISGRRPDRVGHERAALTQRTTPSRLRLGASIVMAGLVPAIHAASTQRPV
jgi:hypothetical protein